MQGSVNHKCTQCCTHTQHCVYSSTTTATV